mmetsp:Transcript_5641/g.22169  ORF Transcript_5641/g.22169 Transcript_5641/m.22169 type:complete len:225 (-) Transcript_5641:2794-3468(-)
MTSSSGPFTYSSQFSSSDERISTSPISSPSLSASITGSTRRASTTGAARYLLHRCPRASARRPRRRRSTSTSCVDVCRLLVVVSNFKHVAREPALVNPGRALAFARASLVSFFALLTSISRAVAPFSRREARATILRAQDDLYHEFCGTYHKPLVLPIQKLKVQRYKGTEIPVPRAAGLRRSTVPTLSRPSKPTFVFLPATERSSIDISERYFANSKFASILAL